MSSISTKNLVKIYDVKSVLDGVAFVANSGDKIALVGENGAGKTTLLRILAGEEEQTKGDVYFDEFMPRVYVSQEFSGEQGETVSCFLGNEKAQRSALRYLDELDVDPSILDLPTGLLSGGQKKIIQLVKAFVSKSPYLFLDEPENHLDYFSREWLIGMLKSYRGCVVFVSHDQYLIDQVANRIDELEDGKLATFSGDYQFYLEEKRKRLEGRFNEWKRMEKEIARHKEMVARMRLRAKWNSDVSGAYRNKVKQLDRLMAAQADRPQLERRRMRLDISDVERKSSKRILALDEFCLTVGEKQLFRNVSLQLFFGAKVCLFGRNGSGKTSFFKVLQGKLKPSSGSVKLGVDMKVGYFSQEHNESLDPEKTPLDELETVVRGGEQRVRSVLANFLIDSVAATRPIKTLSGGQKTRLRFAKLFNREIDFLLLDEPTNHLDTLSWQVLVDAVKAFNGTVVFVSHDRAFVDEVANRLWMINRQTIKESFGGLSELLGE
jgi:ATP-binding cassette subfamily F protein 3